MPVLVEDVFKQVTALSRKGSTGYHSSNDFNDQCRLVQSLLYDYYFSMYENSQRIPDSLRPFLKTPVLNVVNSILSYPADYRHRIEVAIWIVTKGAADYCACPHVHGMEEAYASASFIRSGSIAKKRFYHCLYSTYIKIIPEAFNGVARLKYLSAPIAAFRNFTIDTANDVENYNPIGSVNFQWESMDETNLVDLFLHLKGIQTRQSELLSWVSQKNQLSAGKN